MSVLRHIVIPRISAAKVPARFMGIRFRDHKETPGPLGRELRNNVETDCRQNRLWFTAANLGPIRDTSSPLYPPLALAVEKARGSKMSTSIRSTLICPNAAVRTLLSAAGLSWFVVAGPLGRN